MVSLARKGSVEVWSRCCTQLSENMLDPPSMRRAMVMECLDSGDEEEGLVYIICNQGVKGSVMRATHHR